MLIKKIDNPIVFIKEHSLHDVRIDKILIDIDVKITKIYVNDINWNYERYKEYFERPCVIVLSGVSNIYLDVLDNEGVRIDNVHIENSGGQYKLSIHLNIGGGEESWISARPSICIKFRSIEIIDLGSVE